MLLRRTSREIFVILLRKGERIPGALFKAVLWSEMYTSGSEEDISEAQKSSFTSEVSPVKSCQKSCVWHLHTT